MTTTYEREWQRQKTRKDIPKNHLPVHRWHVRIEQPYNQARREPPLPNVSIMRANEPSIEFYRFLYHSAGEEFLWGDRRRMSDDELRPLISHEDVHLMVMYLNGTPSGFFEMNFRSSKESEIKYFALLPGYIGKGLGGFMLNEAICFAGERKLPLILDTCTLDHGSALENYQKRGFKIYREEDEIYPDPRLDGTIREDAGSHVPRFDKAQ